MHLQECFSYLRYKQGDFPVAEEAALTALALPVYPEMSREGLEYVVYCINEFFNPNS
jgi:dTDP-4-amino-4,6-dideoxygalactose transaminase